MFVLTGGYLALLLSSSDNIDGTQHMQLCVPSILSVASGKPEAPCFLNITDLTDSSMCSLLKSSDNEFTTSNGSEDDDKETGPARPTLPDPFWLNNVDVTPQVFC